MRSKNYSDIFEETAYKKLGIAKPADASKGIDKYIIQWPDQSVRFIFSIRGLSCGFEAFLNSASLRSFFFKIIILMHHYLKLPLGRLLNKERLCITSDGFLNQAMQLHSADDWDIFGGTPGVERNIVISLIKKKKICAYLKLPNNLNQIASEPGLNKEAHNYQIMKDLKLSSSKIPEFSIFENMLIVSPILGRRVREGDAVIIKNSLKEIFLKKSSTIPFQNYLRDKNLLLRLAELKLKEPFDPVFKKNDLLEICSGLENRLRNINRDSEVITAFSVIDFTQWNILVVDGKIGIFDIEFAEQDISVGFDLFHFYIQPLLVSKNNSLNPLNDKLQKKLEEKFVDIYSLPVKLMPFYLDLYLIQNAIRVIELYVDQDQLHWQAIKQIKFWKKFNDNWLNT